MTFATATVTLIKVVAEGLNGPRQIADGPGGSIVVMESDIGQVTMVDLRRGDTSAAVTGLGSLGQGVSYIGGKYVIAIGEAPPEGAPGGEALARQPIEANPADIPASSVLVASNQQVTQLADVLAYELSNNPDKQQQFADPEMTIPLDALSNPDYVLPDKSWKGYAFVADAGGNTVYKVDKKGNLSPFYVLPVVNTEACAGIPNNDPTPDTEDPGDIRGCDPVPTGLAYGPWNTLYVSALTSEVPGEGRVYVLDARTGKHLKTISGFSAPTGVAVDWWGNVYVSELLEGAPPMDGPPPAGFDPADVGQIVKVTAWGKRTYAQVTMPSGLLWKNGTLYASAWSIASFLGIPDAGQVVSVRDSAFVPAQS